jgi:hypothetical protein
MAEYAPFAGTVLASRTSPIHIAAKSQQTLATSFLGQMAGVAVTAVLLTSPTSDVRSLPERTSPPLSRFTTTPPVIARPADDRAPRSTSDIVRELHAKSGLTWEQLGRLVGVSRRAVHLWATGGRINARHLELVMHLHDIVDALPSTEAAERRMLIFAPRHGQPSIFDAFLRQRASEDGVVSGTPFYPDRSHGGRYPEDGSD